MTNNEHTIIVPNDLLKNWEDRFHDDNENVDVLLIEAYEAGHRAGADQELEACIFWLIREGWFSSDGTALQKLRAYRRPKPPSLKEQALKELKDWTDEKHGLGGEAFVCEGLSVAIIRRALESLPD